MAHPSGAVGSVRVAHMGRSWGALLGFGVLSVVAGVLALAWPHATLLFLSILFGAQLAVTGYSGLFMRSRRRARVDGHVGWGRRWRSLHFIAGLYLLRHPMFTVLVVAVILGLYWISHGVLELSTAIGQDDVPARGLTALTGVLSIVAGAVVLFSPMTSVDPGYLADRFRVHRGGDGLTDSGCRRLCASHPAGADGWLILGGVLTRQVTRSRPDRAERLSYLARGWTPMAVFGIVFATRSWPIAGGASVIFSRLVRVRCSAA